MASMVAQPAEPGPEVPAEVDANGHAEKAPEPEAMKLYFVRMPRPPMDESNLKRLQDEFSAHIADIKAINTRLAAKRDVVRQLRNQMYEAKDLKGASQPEFEQKELERLKHLRDLRNGYQTKIAEIKNKVRGLDFRTEAELDVRIQLEEDKIRFGTIPLREEKMVVQEISKLRAMRDKIKEYEAEKSSLAEYEAESAKVKAMLQEMDGEFSIIKGERDSASKVVSDFYTQLKAAEKEAEKVQEEQEAVVEKKNEALEALEAARRETDTTMAPYRENRKFALQVRDLVNVGSVAEATELCTGQVEELMGKLSSDAAFCSDYCQMWADQRRYPVSELLPESSTSAQAAPAKPGKGAKGASSASAPKEKPVPRGAEKAKDMIASIMQKASAAAARAASSAATSHDQDDDGGGDANDGAAVPEAAPAAVAAEPPKPAAPAKPAPPAKLVENPAAKAAEVFGVKVDLPEVEDKPFKVPASAASAVAEAASKEQIRQEQMAKAAEAEERKRKAAEAKVQKAQKAAEAKKRAEEEERRAKAAKEAAKAQEAAAAAAAEEMRKREAAEAKKAADAARAAQSRVQEVARRPVPSARRPGKEGQAKLMAKWQAFFEKNKNIVAVAIVVFVLIVILLLASS